MHRVIALFVLLALCAVLVLPMSAQIIWPPLPEPTPDPAVCPYNTFVLYQYMVNYLPFLTPDLFYQLFGCYPF